MPRLSKIGAACLAAFGYSQGVSTVAANYLTVAGGGGGAYNGGGGGGAGGLLIGITNLNFTESYVVTVGAGGIGSNGISANNGTNGSNSVFSTFATATGGGKGGDIQNNGFTGGSGGGGGTGYNNNAPGTGGSGTVGQGNAGGAGRTLTVAVPASIAGGGGGGASAAGNVGGSAIGGTGGAGTASSISGSSVTYAGGGAGGAGTSVAAGGAGGGGNGGGGSTAATSGSANTGGGGGGGGNPATTGGNGGSGVVIVSYTSPAQLFGGGIVTYVGGNWIHTFRTSGTLVPASTFTASTVIVGGGAGGGYSVGGGGGAGGLLSSTFTLDANSNYIVTVGSGGSGSTTNPSNGTAGSGSNFLTITTAGGGRGANYGENTAGSGGSGAGAAGAPNTLYTAGSGNTPATTPAQGNNGGANAVSNSVGQRNSGGGGGAGAVGQTGTTTKPGNGGAGSINPITGSTTGQNVGGIYYLAGGGGGGSDTSNANQGLGGNGGGGNGGISSSVNGVAGTTNTGGGGGGGNSLAGIGGNGGSGVVIISYAGAQRMAGGTVTFVGGNTIHTFTSSGYLSALKLVNNSLRFKASTSSYFNRTFTASPTTFTWSGWLKRGTLGVQQVIAASRLGGAQSAYLLFLATDQISVGLTNGSAASITGTSTAVYRDPAAWYHIVFSSTAGGNGILYVNGVQVFSGAVPAGYWLFTNTASWVNAIGKLGDFNGQYFDGYMTEINFVDGQALTPSSFGGYNSFGVWQPCQYLGSYGTNGFYLPFTNNTSSTTIGYDFSPNQNNWTANGFTLTPTTSYLYDSMTDVPTLTSATASNFATLNPLQAGNAPSNANLSATTSGTAHRNSLSTIYFTSGSKFYFEISVAAIQRVSAGMATASLSLTAVAAGQASFLGFYGDSTSSSIYNGASALFTQGAVAANDIYQFCVDASTGNAWFGRNNTFYNSSGAATGNPATGANPTWTGIDFTQYSPEAGVYDAGTVANINFGQRPFVGTVPTGFVALNTFNM